METRPVLDVATVYTTPPAPINVPFVNLTAGGTVVIDIHTTQVKDGDSVAYLSSIIKRVDGDNKQLILDGTAPISMTDEDDVTVEAPFDYKYDEENDVMGAGTAFLQESE